LRLYNTLLLLDFIFAMQLTWYVSLRILCYLQAIASYGLLITQDSFLSLHGFTITNRDDSIDDRKLTNGYLVYISWFYSYFMEIREAMHYG